MAWATAFGMTANAVTAVFFTRRLVALPHRGFDLVRLSLCGLAIGLLAWPSSQGPIWQSIAVAAGAVGGLPGPAVADRRSDHSRSGRLCETTLGSTRVAMNFRHLFHRFVRNLIVKPMVGWYERTHVVRQLEEVAHLDKVSRFAAGFRWGRRCTSRWPTTFT